MINWYSFTHEEIQKLLKVKLTSGLTNTQAVARGALNGNMAKLAKGKIAPFIRLMSYFSEVLAYIPIPLLAVACVLGMAFDEDYACEIVLVLLCSFVVVLSVARFIVAWQTDKVTSKSVKDEVKVIRKGKLSTVMADMLAYGDVVILTDKDIVPCDLRIINSSGLYVVENSTELYNDDSKNFRRFRPVLKTDEVIEQSEVKLPKRMWKNCVFKGSVVTSGRALAVVINPDMTLDDAIIALQRPIVEGYETSKLSKTPVVFPFLKRLNLSKETVSEGRAEEMLRSGCYVTSHKDSITSLVSLIQITLSLLVLSVGILSGADAYGIFFFACVTMAFPIGAVCSFAFELSFYLGAKKLFGNGTTVKDFSSLEKLCSVESLMCKKKSMFRVKNASLERVHIGRRTYEASEYFKNELTNILNYACFSADIKSKAVNGKRVFTGEHIELCNFDFAVKCGITDEAGIIKYLARNKEMRSADGTLDGVVLGGSNNVAIIKGSVKKILPKCDYFDTGAGIVSIDDETIEHFNAYAYEAESDDAHSVVAIAIKQTNQKDDNTNDGFTLLGVLVYRLYLDGDSGASVAMCRSSGINPILFTPDMSEGIVENAKRSGVLGFNENSIDGNRLSEMSDEEFFSKIDSYRLFEGLSDEQKRAIIYSKRKRSEVVAVCVDSLSDILPALDGDMIISCGNSSPTLRALSEIHCTREGLSSITQAVEESRRVLKNATNAMKCCVVSLAATMITMLTAFVTIIVLSSINVYGVVNVAPPMSPALAAVMYFVLIPLVVVACVFKPEDIRDLFSHTPKNYIERLCLHDSLAFNIRYGVATAVCALVSMLFAFFSDGGIDCSSFALFITITVAIGLSSFTAITGEKLTKSYLPSMPSVAILVAIVGFCLWLYATFSHVSLSAQFGIFKIDYVTIGVAFLLSFVPFAYSETSKAIYDTDNETRLPLQLEKTEKPRMTLEAVPKTKTKLIDSKFMSALNKTIKAILSGFKIERKSVDPEKRERIAKIKAQNQAKRLEKKRIRLEKQARIADDEGWED